MCREATHADLLTDALNELLERLGRETTISAPSPSQAPSSARRALDLAWAAARHPAFRQNTSFAQWKERSYRLFPVMEVWEMKGMTPCLRCSLYRVQTRNSCGLERETGLEPATPCLEGRYSTN